MDASVPVTAAEESPVVVARRFVTAGIDSCAALQRDDLAKRLHHARARLDEPSTVLYVAGEYKQGKSMLVNALVGSAICPVDDDLSTSTVTWLHHHDPAIARIRRRSSGTSVVEEIPLEDVWRYASERGNPANHLQVDVVHVGLPSQVLAAGLTLVDSPGAGALMEEPPKRRSRFSRMRTPSSSSPTHRLNSPPLKSASCERQSKCARQF